MDFAGIKSLAIPEGSVKKITAGGVVLWEKPASYINLAEPNDTNTTDWSIWTNNARMGSDGGYRAYATSMVTNYIEIKPGEANTFYFYGMDIPESGFSTSLVGSGVQVAVFASAITGLNRSWKGGKSFAQLNDASANNAPYMTYTVNSDGYVTSLSTQDVWKDLPHEFPGSYYFRLALPNTIDKSKIIITRNQPIG